MLELVGLALPPEFGRVGEPFGDGAELVVPGGVEAGEEGSDGLGDSDGPTEARGLADGVGAGAEGDGDEGDGDEGDGDEGGLGCADSGAVGAGLSAGGVLSGGGGRTIR